MTSSCLIASTSIDCVRANTATASRTPPRWRRPGNRPPLRSGLAGRLVLVLGVRLQHERTHTLLCAGVGDGTQQRKAAALTIDGVLACRERDVAATTAATLPDGEADQLQAVELSVGEMQLGIREFAWGVAFVVRRDFDGETHNVTS